MTMTPLVETFALAFDPVVFGPEETKFVSCTVPIAFRAAVLTLQTMEPRDLERILVHDIYLEDEHGVHRKSHLIVIKNSPRSVLPGTLFAGGRDLKLLIPPGWRLVLELENAGGHHVNLIAGCLGMGAS